MFLGVGRTAFRDSKGASPKVQFARYVDFYLVRLHRLRQVAISRAPDAAWWLNDRCGQIRDRAIATVRGNLA